MNLYTLSRRATSTTHPSLLNSLQTHGLLAKPQSIANIQRPTEISATVFPDFARPALDRPGHAMCSRLTALASTDPGSPDSPESRRPA